MSRPPNPETPDQEPPADPIIEHLAQVDASMGELTYMRRVADFQSVEGDSYRAGLDEIELRSTPEAGRYRGWLTSHKKEIIITAGALLVAAGVGVRLQRNRTQRQKMGRSKL